MGLVSVATTAGWKTLALLGYAGIYAYLAPWHLSPTRWYTWVIAILGVDLLYYAYHRIAHRVRLIWATHQAHHSSEYFNFATALRQKWNNSGEIVMWIPLPLLGVPPWMVFFSFSLSLIYQFWVHTERIDKLPRPFEFVFNTPSHHRVHHGMDKVYLDKNYGGILIIWDRLFGSFQPELFRPHYGLTKQVDTFNIWKLQTREYVAIARDWRSASRLRDRLGYVFGPPGWAPRTAGPSRRGRPAWRRRGNAEAGAARKVLHGGGLRRNLDFRSLLFDSTDRSSWCAGWQCAHSPRRSPSPHSRRGCRPVTARAEPALGVSGHGDPPGQPPVHVGLRRPGTERSRSPRGTAGAAREPSRTRTATSSAIWRPSATARPAGPTVATDQQITDYEAIVLDNNVAANNILPGGRPLMSTPERGAVARTGGLPFRREHRRNLRDRGKRQQRVVHHVARRPQSQR